MSKPPRDLAVTQGRTFFLTINSWSGRSLFQVHRLCDLFLSTLQNYREQGRFQLHDFVLMPNHVHLFLSPGEDITLERTVQLIKGGFSFEQLEKAIFGGKSGNGGMWTTESEIPVTTYSIVNTSIKIRSVRGL
jgi:REP element-mobilizing transposase RayT